MVKGNIPFAMSPAFLAVTHEQTHEQTQLETRLQKTHFVTLRDCQAQSTEEMWAGAGTMNVGEAPLKIQSNCPE